MWSANHCFPLLPYKCILRAAWQPHTGLATPVKGVTKNDICYGLTLDFQHLYHVLLAPWMGYVYFYGCGVRGALHNCLKTKWLYLVHFRYFVIMCKLFVCLGGMHRMYVGAYRNQKRASNALKLVSKAVVSYKVWWGMLNLGPEHGLYRVLTPRLPFQPPGDRTF